MTAVAPPIEPRTSPVGAAGPPVVLSTARGPLELVEAGEGPAVLAIHGAMGGWDQSLLLARTIGAAGHRYLAVSRPGYLGTPLRSGRSAAEQADLLAAALDALRVERAAVMAVSGGGYSALELAIRHPDRCAALVLVSTVSGVVDTPIPLSFQLMKRLMRVRWIAERLARKAAADPEAAAVRSIPDPAVRARTLADPEAGPLLRELLRSTIDRPWLRIAGTDNDIAVTRRTEYALERIAAPTLVVHGTADAVAPYRHGAALAARIPGAELLAVEGGQHVAIFTDRAQVRPRVAAFLRRCAT